MKWYFIVLGKYAVFEGRASRKEYWCFKLLDILITIVLIKLDIYVFVHSGKSLSVSSLSEFFPVMASVYTLATVIPSYTVLVRRLHDTGRSAWWLLLLVVPPPLTPLGFIVLFCFTLRGSEPRGNKYG